MNVSFLIAFAVAFLTIVVYIAMIPKCGAGEVLVRAPIGLVCVKGHGW